jgi:hypothetical protein
VPPLNKTYLHDITEILLKAALSIINPNPSLPIQSPLLSTEASWMCYLVLYTNFNYHLTFFEVCLVYWNTRRGDEEIIHNQYVDNTSTEKRSSQLYVWRERSKIWSFTEFVQVRAGLVLYLLVFQNAPPLRKSGDNWNLYTKQDNTFMKLPFC